jgi:DNA-binding winged helix-turn-helix (wHTH) protein/predicted ATPase
VLYFAGYRFASRSQWLTRDGNEVRLRPKTAAVLGHLLVRPGEMVTKRELLDAVWPDGVVGDEVLAVCINELRRALDDHPQNPRFIATVHRRGYRFVAPVSASPLVAGSADGRSRNGEFVGREFELATLGEWWQAALTGERQVAFIAAESGVGKTTLVGEFVDRLRQHDQVLVGNGQCVEQFGGGEPYLPFLDALAGLCGAPGGHRFREVLRERAPMWLLQMPGLVDEGDLAELRARTATASASRMLRESGDALDALSAAAPVVLVCEDLHSGDRSTAELLSYLAQRHTPARLLVLCTYRVPDIETRSLRPVVQELRGRRQCRFLELQPFGASAIEAYLARRLAPSRPSASLVDSIARRTNGNALFLVTVVDQLVMHGLLRNLDGEVSCDGELSQLGVPDSVQQLIGRRLEDFGSTDRELLEIASVAGVEFSAAAVLAGTGDERAGIDRSDFDEQLSDLARRTALLHEIEPAQWPDGTVTARFRFVHQLHREVLYGQISPGWRSMIHRRVADRLESGHAARLGEIAAELAMHFERARVTPAAVRFFTTAAETALRRRAPREALNYLDRAADLLDTTAPGPDRSAAELRIRMNQAAALMAIEGIGGPGVADAYAAARTLCREIDDPGVLAPAWYGLWNYALTRGDIHRAAELADGIVTLVKRGGDPAFRLQALNARAVTHLFAGEPAAARRYTDQGLELFQPAIHRRHTHYFEDPGVLCHVYAAFAGWLLGFPDEARRHADEALRRATEVAEPGGLCQCLWPVAAIYQLCGDVARVHDLSVELLRLARANELPVWASAALILDGWVAVQNGEPAGAIAQIQEGLANLATIGVEVMRPYQLALLADAAKTTGQTSVALEAATTALDIINRTGERWIEAELVRRRADLTLQLAHQQSPGWDVEIEVEKMLREALDIARRQQSRSFELRAATSLARLQLASGRLDVGRAVLAETYDSFPEGYDTADLRAAWKVLGDLTTTLGA